MPSKSTRKTSPKTNPVNPPVEETPEDSQAQNTPPAEAPVPTAEEPPQSDEPAKPDPLAAGQALDPATLGVGPVPANTAPVVPVEDEPPQVAPQAAPPVEQGPAGAQTREAEPVHLLIVVRRPHTFAGEERPIGWPLAEVRLAPGVCINTLVDAVRTGFATDKPAD